MKHRTKQAISALKPLYIALAGVLCGVFGFSTGFMDQGDGSSFTGDWQAAKTATDCSTIVAGRADCSGPLSRFHALLHSLTPTWWLASACTTLSPPLVQELAVITGLSDLCCAVYAGSVDPTNAEAFANLGDRICVDVCRVHQRKISQSLDPQ